MDQQGKKGKQGFHGQNRSAGGYERKFDRSSKNEGGGKRSFNGERRSFGDEKKAVGGFKNGFNKEGSRRDGFQKKFGGEGFERGNSERKHDFDRRNDFRSKGGFAPKSDLRKKDARASRQGMRGDRKPEAVKQEAPTARDVALKAFRSVARENAYAAQALDRELSVVRLSDEDRRLAASLFYFTLENRLRIEKLIAGKVKDRPEPEVMEILDVGAAQILFMDKIPDHAAVDEAVKQTRKAGKESMTALVNAVLRGLIRDRDADELKLPDHEAEPESYISEKYSVALPLVKRLVAAYGVDSTEEIAAWSPDRHWDTIRPNRMRMSDAEFEAWLNANGFRWEKGSVSGAYRIFGAGRLASYEGYRKGLFSIQGESSMLAALALCAKPGMQVLDACAAPGGKSCLIAEIMKGAGRVYAWDLHEHRVELIKAAALRLGLENIRPQTRDATKKNEALEDAMDAVLVDVPCSGLGVMGDKPDIKYRLTTDTIDALIPIQRDILNTCASYVRPGGLMVYSTCTILPEENQKQVEAFLETHPDFEADTNVAWLPERFREAFENGMLQLLPTRDGVDGFFIARLRRKAGV